MTSLDTESKPETTQSQAIRCTIPSCSCTCFSPSHATAPTRRTCHTCKHGWVAHALDKLGYRSLYQVGMQVEVVQPNIVFDIASLMLYGAHATPIRLKILLDRLFSVLQHDEVLQVLHGFGWNYEDYARGYILQDSSGKVLDKWTVCSREEEQVILQQFLRFGETKSIAEEIILQDARDSKKETELTPPSSSSSVTSSTNSTPSTTTNMFSRGAYDSLRLYPGATPSSGRLLSPSMSPGSTSTPTKPLTLPLRAPSPMSGGSPLSRLQGMQPFDFRKEQLSPISPAPSDKSIRTSASSPQNLSMASSVSVPATPTKAPEPIKIEPLDDMKDHDDDQPLELRRAPSVERHEGKVEPKDYRNEGMAAFIRGSEELAAKYARKAEEMAQYAKSREDLAKYARSREELMKYAEAQRKCEEMAKYSHNEEVAKYTSRMMSENQPKEDSSGALDYSVKDTAPATSMSTTSSSSSHNVGSVNSSIYAEQKVRHLRKSANPMKRNYSPTPGYGGTLISPSGKKRVLCTACNKTFCDKGALKIHYSAVHLKEMHKCTVDGCNMMFSSRRSRNRHSANPNPKLHMPQNRRKLPEGAIVVDEKSEDYPHHPHHQQHHHRPAPHRPASIPGLMTHPQPPRDVVAPIATMPLDPSKHHHMSPLPPHANSMAALTAMMSSTSAFYLGGHYNPAAFMASLPKMPKLDHQEYKPRSYSECATTSSSVSTTSSNITNNTSSSSAVSPVRSQAQQLPRDPPAPTMSSQSSPRSQPSLHDLSSSSGSSRRKRKSLAPTRCTQSQDLFELSDDEVISMPDSGSDIEEGMVPTADSLKSVSSDMDSLDEDSQTSTKDSEPPKNGYVDREVANNFSEIREQAIRQMNNIGLNLSKDAPPVLACDNNGYLDLSMRSAERMEEDLDDDDYGSDPELDNIPLDKDNPLRCPQCGHVFQNHFLVKSHYQSVHLKLRYTCTIAGCNAAFPSKRSRDRHSSNLNLHRKLLSTSTMEREPVGARHEEYLPRGLYDSAAHYSYLHHMARAAGYEQGSAESHSSTTATTKHSSECGSPASNDGSTSNKENERTATSPPVKPEPTSSNNNHVNKPEPPSIVDDVDGADSSLDADDLPLPDPDGSVSCHVCSQRFRDNLVLKEHFEKLHPKEMYHCTITGCDKIFSTRKSRNRHSQNDNLHKHLMLGASRSITA